MKTIKEKIYELFQEETSQSFWNLFIDKFIIILVIINIITLILETSLNVSSKFIYFSIKLEFFSVIVFTIEYIIRIYLADKFYPCNNKLKSIYKFVISKRGLVDLVSILPFYLPLIFNCNLLILRLLKFLKFIRGLKIFRYNKSLNIIFDVLYNKRKELLMTCSLALTVLIIAAVSMFYLEHKVQPDKFPDIMSCFWWAIATLTTIGYGDVYPITSFGRFVAGTIAIIGIGLVALPTAILSTGFIEKLTENSDIEDENDNTIIYPIYSCRNKCHFLCDMGNKFYCTHISNDKPIEILMNDILFDKIPIMCPLKTNETLIKYKISKK